MGPRAQLQFQFQRHLTHQPLSMILHLHTATPHSSDRTKDRRLPWLPLRKITFEGTDSRAIGSLDTLARHSEHLRQK